MEMLPSVAHPCGGDFKRTPIRQHFDIFWYVPTNNNKIILH